MVQVRGFRTKHATDVREFRYAFGKNLESERIGLPASLDINQHFLYHINGHRAAVDVSHNTSGVDKPAGR